MQKTPHHKHLAPNHRLFSFPSGFAESGEENVGQNDSMESTTLKSKLFIKNEKSAARRTSTPESMTQRAATQRGSGPAAGGDGDSTTDLTSAMGGGGPSGGGAGAGGGGGGGMAAATTTAAAATMLTNERRDTKVDIPLPQYMTPSVEKFADKRVKVSPVNSGKEADRGGKY